MCIKRKIRYIKPYMNVLYIYTVIYIYTYIFMYMHISVHLHAFIIYSHMTPNWRGFLVGFAT